VAASYKSARVWSRLGGAYIRQKPGVEYPLSSHLDAAAVPDQLGLDGGRRVLRKHAMDDLHLLCQTTRVDAARGRGGGGAAGGTRGRSEEVAVDEIGDYEEGGGLREDGGFGGGGVGHGGQAAIGRSGARGVGCKLSVVPEVMV
jgi:hypothetical protein